MSSEPNIVELRPIYDALDDRNGVLALKYVSNYQKKFPNSYILKVSF